MDCAIFEIFKQYTGRYIELTDEDLERIESVCIYKKLRKQQYLLQEGDVWRSHAFIAKGCLRTYSIDEKGVEHIVGFGISNWWVGDLESLKSNTPSLMSLGGFVVFSSETHLGNSSTFFLTHRQDILPSSKGTF